MSYIGLLDCNNFFVSCERLFRPDLLHTPVVVLSSNDGCVVARSQEVKDNGIPMGVPYFHVKDKLAEMGAVTFSSHFALYRDISRRVFEIARNHLGMIEQYSIDECFFIVEEGRAEAVATEIRNRIWQEVGIPVSIGLAHSKTRAKYASRLAKKTNGIKILSVSDWETLAPGILLAELWGVGAGRTRQFSARGISTVADFCVLPMAVVESLFGLEGVRLRAELLGQPVFSVAPSRAEQKSLMSTRSFAKTTSDFGVLADAVSYHLHQVVKDLHELNLQTVALRVLIYPSSYSDFALQGASAESVFSLPTNDIFTLEKEAMRLLKTCFKSAVPYKKAGVVLARLTNSAATTASLFPGEPENTVLTETLLALNKRYGKTLVQLGRVPVPAGLQSSRHDRLSPEYTTRWSDLRVVKA